MVQLCPPREKLATKPLTVHEVPLKRIAAGCDGAPPRVAPPAARADAASGAPGAAYAALPSRGDAISGVSPSARAGGENILRRCTPFAEARRGTAPLLTRAAELAMTLADLETFCIDMQSAQSAQRAQRTCHGGGRIARAGRSIGFFGQHIAVLQS